MSGALVNFQKQSLRLSEPEFGTKNAWAKYVRSRWPRDAQAWVEREWDLSPGRANGVVFANITQRTIDAIYDHPRGGPAVALAVTAIRFGMTAEQLLSNFIQQERGRLRRERDANERDDARMAAMARDLAAVVGVGARRPLGLVGPSDRKARNGAGRRDRRQDRGAE